MKKRILVTGSSGMLGTDLVLLLGQEFDVVGTDIAQSKEPLFRHSDFLACDIRDKNSTLETVKKARPDVLVHTAAWTDVDGCELDKESATRINFTGTQNIVSACKETSAVIVYISSDFVFDGRKEEPYMEDDATNPINAYGLSKLKGEEAVRKGLDRYFIVRTSWLFGKNGRNFVDIIIDKAERGQRLKVVMDQFGSPTYTKDLAGGLRRLILSAMEGRQCDGVYHFCNSGSCSWFRYAEEILKDVGKPLEITPITSEELDRPAQRPRMSILNTDKYTAVFGEKPRSWQEALRDYLLNDARKSARDYVQGFKK